MTMPTVIQPYQAHWHCKWPCTPTDHWVAWTSGSMARTGLYDTTMAGLFDVCSMLLIGWYVWFIAMAITGRIK